MSASALIFSLSCKNKSKLFKISANLKYSILWKWNNLFLHYFLVVSFEFLFYVSSLRRGQANLLCIVIVLILVYEMRKQALNSYFEWLRLVSELEKWFEWGKEGNDINFMILKFFLKFEAQIMEVKIKVQFKILT